MKRYRLFFVLALLGLAVSCSDPVVPRYPSPDDETENDDDPTGTDSQGFVLGDLDLYFV